MEIYPLTRFTIPKTSNLGFHWISMRWTRRWRDSSGRSIRKGAWLMANHDLRATMRLGFQEDHRNLLLTSTFKAQRKARSLASSYVRLPPHTQPRNEIQEIYYPSNQPLTTHSEQRSIQKSPQNRGSAISARRTKSRRRSLLFCERWDLWMTRGILLS